MTTSPWFRTPVDVLDVPGMRTLRPELRYTYLGLFGRARRHPEERLGWVLDELGDPPTIRTLSSWMGLPRSTTKRHHDDLLDRGLLLRDLAGRLIVPAVVVVEQRLGRRKDTTSTRASATSTEAVEIPAFETLPFLSGVPPADRNLEIRDKPSFSSSVDVENDDVVLRENLGDSDVIPELPTDRVPAIVDDDDVRYLLSQLVDNPAWSRAMATPRDLRNLVVLARTNRAGVLQVLRQEVESPQARNALAYLNGTLATLDEEVAS